MGKKMVQVEIESSGYELTKSLTRLTGAVKQSLADGWQPGTDVPVIISAAISELGALAANIPQLAPDAKDDAVEFAKGINLAAYDFLEIFTAKAPAAPEAPKA